MNSELWRYCRYGGKSYQNRFGQFNSRPVLSHLSFQSASFSAIFIHLLRFTKLSSIHLRFSVSPVSNLILLLENLKLFLAGELLGSLILSSPGRVFKKFQSHEQLELFDKIFS